MMMDTFSLWHWIIAAVWIFLIAVPVARILTRLGMSGWWSILAFIPVINLIALWVLAFVRWPRDSRSEVAP